MKTKIYAVLAVSLFVISMSCRQEQNFQFVSIPQKKILINEKVPLPLLLDSLRVDFKKTCILIDKSDYLLSILSDTTIIKQYPVVFGGNPEDDKLREGDCCTPEGKFKVVIKYPHNIWSKFILIDYPNNESWKKFNNAIAAGTIPSDSHIGGAIGIHGVPEGADFAIDIRQNWTLGCISLKNHDINELYDFISINHSIIIRK